MLDWVNSELEKATAKVKASEDSLTQYRETNNAQSLDDRQNVVVSRLNSLSQTVTGKRTERQQKEAMYNQVKNADPASDSADGYPLIGNSPAVVLAQGDARHVQVGTGHARAELRAGQPADEGHRSEDPGRPPGCWSPSGAGSSTTRRTTSKPPSRRNAASPATSSGRRPTRWTSIARAATTRSCMRDYDANQELFKSLLDQQKNLSVVANNRANNVRLMDRAEPQRTPISPNPAQGLAHRDPRRADDRLRPRVRHRVPRRHRQDARGRHAPAEAAAARPRPGDPRRPRADPHRDGAARLRRGVPIAQDVARLHERRRVDAHRSR